MKNVHLQLASWERDRLHIEAIRFAVYMVEKEDPFGLSADREDGNSHHVLASDASGRYVATGRLEPDGRLSRIVVLPEFREHRIGDEILKYLAAIARQFGLEYVYTHAHERHVPYLSKLGFEHDSPLPPTAGKPRYRMRLALVD